MLYIIEVCLVDNMILKDFYCKTHGAFETSTGSDDIQARCPICQETSPVAFFKAPSIGGDLETDFSPHYDGQLGKHFQCADEKLSYLKKTGRTLEEGRLSPKKSTPGAIRCTRSQAEKQFGKDEVRPTPIPN